MTAGRIVHTPDERHRCPTPSDDGRTPYNRHAPRWWPAGTVWECACGRTWVIRADQLPPGYVNRKGWVPEGRIARWRRERRQTWHVPTEPSTAGPPSPLQPAEPTVCLLDHRHTADCPGAQRTEPNP